MRARYICVEAHCTAERGTAVRRAGNCPQCGKRLYEIDERYFFPWRRVFIGVILVTLAAGTGVAWPTVARRVEAARVEAEKKQALAALTASREAAARVRSLLQADLIQATHLAEVIVHKELNLRTLERNLADFGTRSDEVAATYRDAAATLERAIDGELSAYRDALGGVAANRAVFEKSAAASPELALEADPVSDILSEIETADGAARDSVRQATLRLVRRHAKPASAGVATVEELRASFVALSQGNAASPATAR